MIEKSGTAFNREDNDIVRNRVKIMVDMIRKGDSVIFTKNGMRREMIVDRVMRFSNGNITFRLKGSPEAEDTILAPAENVFPIYVETNNGEKVDVRIDCARSRFEMLLKQYEPKGASTNTVGCRNKY